MRHGCGTKFTMGSRVCRPGRTATILTINPLRLAGMAAEPLIAAEYQIGDLVEKYTGDYCARGEIHGIFTMKNGAVRYVVEHKADGRSFCHIYSEKNLRRLLNSQETLPGL